ncbi:MAG: molybdopterin-binding protein [Hyphomicrobium sp.]
MSEETSITAAVLVIGDEILSGRTKDKNIGVIADRLTEIGIDLKEVRIVGDDVSAIVEAVNALRHHYTYVFTTGGIGPTHDDITVDCIGKALALPIEENQSAVALMRSAYDARGIELTPTRLRMARMPIGSELIVTPASGAPGFKIGNLIVMAGVPSIMQAMLSAATQQLRTGRIMNTVSIVLWLPESEIAELFAEHQKAYPDVAMGSYPAFVDGRYRTELVLRSKNGETLDRAHHELKIKLTTRGLTLA